MDSSTYSFYAWHHLGLPWADAVVDARRKPSTRLADMQVVLGAHSRLPGREVTIAGWVITPHLVPFGCDPFSLLQFTAPDGWRGGIAFDANTRSRRFAWAYLPTMLPYLGRYMSRANMTSARRDQMRDMTAFGLPLLRTTLSDPFAWAADEMPDDGDGEMTADLIEWMLTWASCGVLDADATVLNDHRLEPIRPSWDTGTADLALWWRHGVHDPHEVATWVEASVRTPGTAAWLTKKGFTADEALAWAHTPVAPMVEPEVTVAFRNAGWTATAIRRLAQTIRHLYDPTSSASPDHAGQNRQFYPLVATWRDIAHPSIASAYIDAGVSLPEARNLELAGQRPDPDALALLAAFQAPNHEHWDLRPEWVGTPVSPRHLGATM